MPRPGKSFILYMHGKVPVCFPLASVSVHKCLTCYAYHESIQGTGTTWSHEPAPGPVRNRPWLAAGICLPRSHPDAELRSAGCQVNITGLTAFKLLIPSNLHPWRPFLTPNHLLAQAVDSNSSPIIADADIMAEIKNTSSQRLTQIKDFLTFQKTATTLPWDPDCTIFPTRKELPSIPGAPPEAAWCWGEKDYVSLASSRVVVVRGHPELVAC